jgi:Type II CAAX prenyl endopeptidase Rce1-like
LGTGFRLSPNAYLLLGIPLTLLFQWFVRRAALRSLWVHDAPAFRLGLSGVVVAVGLAAFPISELAHLFRAGLDLVLVGWLLAATCGTVPAAYAIKNFGWATVAPFVSCLATGGVVGVLLFALAFIAHHGSHVTVGSGVQRGGASLLLYFPAVFMMEEVSFRGLLDAHLHRPDDRQGILTAIYVSILWGLWHYPIVHPVAGLIKVIPQLLIPHVLIGVPLSIFWRRSGNLVVPAFTHALIDSVRNALMGLP